MQVGKGGLPPLSVLTFNVESKDTERGQATLPNLYLSTLIYAGEGCALTIPTLRCATEGSLDLRRGS